MSTFNDKAELMLEQVQADAPSRVPLFKKAYSGKSLRASINAFCMQCVWLDTDQIKHCTALGCPLWSVRPYRRKPRGIQMPQKRG